MSKTYYFNDDTWIDAPVCDCCDYEIEMECYNINRDYHTDLKQNGSLHTMWEVYEFVLICENIINEHYTHDIFDTNKLDENDLEYHLYDIVQKNNINIVFLN